MARMNIGAYVSAYKLHLHGWKPCTRGFGKRRVEGLPGQTQLSSGLYSGFMFGIQQLFFYNFI
jgi:hypothetical protein